MEQHTPVKTSRLFFIDAIRAWAILMMLQGHFIDGLLDSVFRDRTNPVFHVWQYFRGVTAPVFFTVSGFVFTYLLVQAPGVGLENTRVRKGIRRGLQLLLIGYALRLHLGGLLQGELYAGFYTVDVLHCIGLSLLCLVALYVGTARRPAYVFPLLLLGVTLVLFVGEPVYATMSYDFLPVSLAHYVTKAHGAVFTIFPWLGYATAGGAVAVLFARYKNHTALYPYAIGVGVLLGYGLVFHSSAFFALLYEWTGVALFEKVQANNYLLMRLGDVCWVFAVFMAVRGVLTHPALVRLGSSTLSIYVVHFIVLYGGVTGWGLYQLFYQALTPGAAVAGAVAFTVGCAVVALLHARYEGKLKRQGTWAAKAVKKQAMDRYSAALLGYKWRILRGRVRVQQWLRS